MTSSVVVAIPTFHRPDMLDALLTAIASQVAEVVGARVLVIDNDPDASARGIAGAHGVDYVVEPGRGLAAVRNRAIDEATDENALVFIDDDEVPDAGWLRTLVDRWRETGAAAVSGRVETRFPAGWHDPWIDGGGFFQRVRFADGAHQHAAPTNNLLLDLSAVRRHGIRFDPAFGLSGGEDVLFTKQLVAAGESIVACPGALVFDVVDPSRLNRRWVLRRAYRVGISSVRTELALRAAPSARAGARLKGLVGGGARIFLGGSRWLIGEVLRSPRHSARGARAVWRGAGMTVGALGGDYQEYAYR